MLVFYVLYLIAPTHNTTRITINKKHDPGNFTKSQL